MKVFIAWDGDHIGREVGRASLDNNVEKLRRISQAIEHGNTIWRSWVEANGGSIISYGGDEGRAEIPADRLDQLPKIREQYAGCVEAAVSVGVGHKLSQADQALLVAKLRGGDRVVLWTPEVGTELKAFKASHPPRSEEDKLADAYLGKAEAPGLTRGSIHAGMTGAHHASQQKAPMKTRVEGSEHSEGEAAARFAANNDPGSPEKTHTRLDYEQLFHAVAEQRGRAQAGGAEGEPATPQKQADMRGKVVEVLQEIREQAPYINQLKESAPEAWKAIMELVSAMIQMAKQVQPAEPMQKAEGVAPAMPKPSWEYHVTHRSYLHTVMRAGLRAHPSFKHVHDEPMVLRFLTTPTTTDGAKFGVESIQIRLPSGRWTPLIEGIKTIANGGLHKAQRERAEHEVFMALNKGMFREAAFRHRLTGDLVGTGAFHNIYELPEAWNVNVEDQNDINQKIEAGFFDHAGKFYNRAEAAAADSRAEGANLQSEDLRDQGLGRQEGDATSGGGAGLVKDAIDEAAGAEMMDKAQLPMPHANPHHHVKWPVGAVDDRTQKVKVQHQDGMGRPDGSGWVQVQDGQVLSHDGHPISARNPGAR